MEEIQKKNSHKIWGTIFVLVVLAGLVGYVLFGYLGIQSEEKLIQKNNEASLQSMLENDPTALQESFAQDVKNGENTMLTKSAAYFITHRYFDNGGNIYEIYDYVNNNPSLAFLKEAEKVYPTTFQKIAEKSVRTTFSGYGTHAYLAYLGVLDKYGYADIAARSTAANQYIKIAYEIKKAPEQLSVNPAIDVEKSYQTEIERSLYFQEKAKEDVEKILGGQLTAEDIPSRDIVVGLNQYAAALRYYEALGVEFSSPKKAQEIFAFSTDYAKAFVPELYIFTSFLDASTLALIRPGDTNEIRSALTPVLGVDVERSLSKGTVINKILQSKSENPGYITGTQVKDIDYDIYGKNNVVRLAFIVPEFKTWLVANGWEESDFKFLEK